MDGQKLEFSIGELLKTQRREILMVKATKPSINFLRLALY